MFGKLGAHQEELFYGTITEEYDYDDDTERDGGKAWLSKLVPKVFKRRQMNVIASMEPNNNSVVLRQDGDSTVKFYYNTQIMEAVDGSVYLKAVFTPTTPEEGKFILDGRQGESSHLKNETETYVVLRYKDMQLTSVRKGDLEDKDIYSLITIFASNLVKPGDPDTALYFPATEDHKRYHYYLVPQDSPGPRSDIGVKKVCVDKLSEQEIYEENRRQMAFTQTYNNPSAKQQDKAKEKKEIASTRS